MALAFVVVLTLVTVLLGAAWVWTGSSSSLATVLAQVAQRMPAGRTLQSRDVSGSARAGGRIGWLRYESPTLAVELHDTTIGWQWRPLLKKRVQLGELHVARVVAEKRGPGDDSPTRPLQELTLPVEVDLPFQVDAIDWSGPPPLQARNLAGRYRYTGGTHQLEVDGIDVAEGHYSGRATLQGAAPMALDAALATRLRTAVPGTEGTSVALQGQATVKGSLATEAARLAVAARLQQTETGTAPATSADLKAQIAPWLPQPLVQLDARLAALDLAAFWPQLPTTLLEGQVQVQPEADGLRASADLGNAIAGPWDQKRLPVDELQALATLQQGTWTVPEATVRTGGGEIRLEARFTPAVPSDAAATAAPPTPPTGSASPATSSSAPPSPPSATPETPAAWNVNATLRNIRPGALYTRLEGPAIGGTAKAETRGSAILFDADLQASGPAPAKAQSPRKDRAAPAGSPLDGLGLRSLAAKGEWNGRVLDLARLQVQATDASLQGTAEVRVPEQAGEGQLSFVLPGAAGTVQGRMAPASGNGELSLRMRDAARMQAWIARLPGLSGVFAGIGLDGAVQLDGRWQGGWKSLQQRLANGTAPRGGDLTLQATLDAPRLEVRLPAAAPAAGTATAATAPATAAGSAGAAAPTTTAATGMPAPAATAATGTEAAGNAAVVPASAAGKATTPAAAVKAGLPQTIALRKLRAEVSGSLAQATLSLQGDATMGTRRANLRTAASGGMDGPGKWRLALDRLQLEAQDSTLSGPWNLVLDAPVSATVRQEARGLSVEATAGQASLRGPVDGTVRLAWEPVRYSQTTRDKAPAAHRLQSRGRLTGLPMAWAQAFTAGGKDALADLGLAGNLVFDGDWDIDAGDSLRARASLARQSGDIRVETGEAPAVTRVSSSGTGTGIQGAASSSNAPTTAAGIRQARVELKADGDALAAELLWDSERAGQITASASTRLQRADGGWRWAEDAPLAGKLDARLPNVGVWSVLAPPGWRVQGSLQAAATLGGNRAAPRWNGTLDADGLSVRSVVDGVELRNGRLRSTLRDDRLEITELTLQGGTGSSTRIAGIAGSRSTGRGLAGDDGGSLTARGDLAWGDGIRVALNTEIRALRVSVRPDRQVTLSGNLQTRLEKGRLTLRGALTADRAAIILPDGGAPGLGSDVVVHSAAKDREAARAAEREDQAATRVDTAQPPDIVVTFDMGDDFAVQGKGLTTRLTGKLEIASTMGLGVPPRVTGDIRTVQGRYRAYGQQLDIESGLARFSGAYDNPALDILAIRPNIAVRAGVQITGSAQSPVVRLYSDPDLPDAEKLSWVVLGRAAASGGAEAALLQQAALALLSGGGGGSGNIAAKVGLDEVGFKGPGSGSDASAAALTFGKRVSQNVYLTYERSLSGTLGTLYIFYDLTRRLQLRGQTGAKSAVDLVYTITYD
ncbi:translocation/assembly module TamB domain-containing protein [Xylophilus ampelinus]|uniref:translocation/assembly module TamB domain-containing protein n=1 Tax=Xylophilus ampelinus TaxID=54067 RepID=UPI00216B4D48|nr:translocation/assembly module TamB domain-containing protein [Xylophilus ampelinus]MCS4509426.1 translocation/assembly module TamB domain-containing protein [Xylophilus ampelinus]